MEKGEERWRKVERVEKVTIIAVIAIIAIIEGIDELDGLEGLDDLDSLEDLDDLERQKNNRSEKLRLWCRGLRGSILEEEGGVERVETGVEAVDGETVGGGGGHFEADGERLAGFDETDWDVDFLEIAVGACFVEGARDVLGMIGIGLGELVEALSEPGEGSTVIGWIIGESDVDDGLTIDLDGYIAGVGFHVGLRITVGESAWIGNALTAHEVAFGLAFCTVLTIETLGRGFEDQGSLAKLLDFDVFGYHDFVFEVSATESIELLSFHWIRFIFEPL